MKEARKTLYWQTAVSSLVYYMPLISNIALAQAPISPQTKTLVEPQNFFVSDLGVQIAWYASILGVILGVIPLVMYSEKEINHNF